MTSHCSRREFLCDVLAAAATGLVGPYVARAAAEQGKAPLTKPEFYWGTGIENCWMAQTDPQKDGNRRLLDVYLQMQHYENWKQDLDLLHDVGVNCVRYSVPWYRAEPRPGVYDWSWIDGPVEYLVRELGIIPIMDLIHYGTPTWMADGVIDTRFPEALGRYAGAMAEHFRGLVNHFTPHNEPQVTCAFCGGYGIWPPYAKSTASWVQVGLAVARGMVLETEAIRAALADAVIISADVWFGGQFDEQLRALGLDPQQDELQAAAATFPSSLAYGTIRSNHVLVPFLQQHGAQDADLAWIEQRVQKPDVVGYNYYPDIFDFGWKSGVDEKNVDFSGNGARPLEEAARDAVARIKPGLRRAAKYFELPVYLTETSAGLSTEARVAYIHAVGNMVDELRREHTPLVGVNWWPLFDTIQWDYRDNVDRPLVDFIYEGGWNNGLYRIEVQPNGILKRVPTEAAGAYRNMICRR